jgi:AAA15 family ATPase/GTPase
MKLKQIRVDGYKNLIDCEVNLGDFNVLVGPNNSGKSNLFETMQMLGGICFGTEKLRDKIFEGLTPPQRFGHSICHLQEYKGKPLTLGIAFETDFGERSWAVDYEVQIQCGEPDGKDTGFIRELLTAKEVLRPGKPGRVTTYLLREKDKGKDLLKVKERNKVALKDYPISKKIPSLQAISSLYPDFKGLPPELKDFEEKIKRIGTTNIFAISPKGMRENIDTEKQIEGTCVSSFDLLFALDKIETNSKYYKLFKESLCDILGFEDALFKAEDASPIDKNDTPQKTLKRMRFFAIKCTGSEFSLIEEYSDGTFVVAAILAALFSEDDRGPVLCLEELENCLHPAAIEKLLRFLQDNSDKWPVLITTHSSYLLNGVNPTDVNVAVVDESGATHFEKVKNTKQLRDYLNKGLMSFGDLLFENYKQFRE